MNECSTEKPIEIDGKKLDNLVKAKLNKPVPFVQKAMKQDDQLHRAILSAAYVAMADEDKMADNQYFMLGVAVISSVIDQIKKEITKE